MFPVLPPLARVARAMYNSDMEVVYRLQGSEFEWDDEKAATNTIKHGVTFEEAAEVFFDPFYTNG
jgi:uncharacterized protein